VLTSGLSYNSVISDSFLQFIKGSILSTKELDDVVHYGLRVFLSISMQLSSHRLGDLAEKQEALPGERCCSLLTRSGLLWSMASY
jgi:hypothetical protein